MAIKHGDGRIGDDRVADTVSIPSDERWHRVNAPDARNDRRREDHGKVYPEAGSEVALAGLQKQSNRHSHTVHSVNTGIEDSCPKIK